MDPLDLSKVKANPLGQRKNLTRIQDLLIEPGAEPAKLDAKALAVVSECAQAIVAARKRKASVILFYGENLIRSGGGLILIELMARNWLTHLATDERAAILDWECSATGIASEKADQSLKAETGRNIHLALYAGGIRGEGFGRALGRFIRQDGVTFPKRDDLLKSISTMNDLLPARTELLAAMDRGEIRGGPEIIVHHFKNTSVIGAAFHQDIPLTIHPAVGSDLFFNNASFDRAAAIDFNTLTTSVETLDHGVVLLVGTDLIGRQLFENALNFANDLRTQSGRPAIQDYTSWKGDDVAFLHNLYARLLK